jgi:DsbE subfamily thiol:disulfide oxidoreductase
MRWVVIGIAALLVGLLSYGVASQGTDTSIDAAIQQGKRPPAPEDPLPVLGSDQRASVEDYRGKVVLVNFWASWCKPCTDELPLLQEAQRVLERRGATVLGVNSRDATEDALQFVRRYDLTFPSLRDGSGDFAELWGLTGLPESFVIDREGRVAAFLRGPLNQEWIDEQVMPLLEDA